MTLRVRGASLTAVVLLAVALARSQSSKPFEMHESDAPGKRQWVTFLGPESQTVAASGKAEVALRFHIEDGYHVNSHTPKSDYLIPTQLLVIEEPGITAQQVDFPEGSEYAFSFDPTNKLDVYAGDITLTAHIQATRGEHTLHAVLRYQACDHAACYPPKSLPVQVKLTVP